MFVPPNYTTQKHHVLNVNRISWFVRQVSVCVSFWLCESIELFDCVFGGYVVRVRLGAFSPSIGSRLMAGIRFQILLCLLVTTLRVHPAVTRLTVYRRPYVF